MMQNSLNIKVDDQTNDELEVMERKTRYTSNYLNLSLKSLTYSDDEQTFRKEIDTGERYKTAPTGFEQTFLKEKYDTVTDEMIHRNAHDSNMEQHGENNYSPIIPRPPEERWNLKLLLVQLAKETSDEDLNIIKFLMQGIDDENASTIKVYDLMQARKFITVNDLLYLQVIMAILGKDSLIVMVHKFAQSQTNVLHFDPPLKDIVIGESLEDVSIRGADFHRYTPTQRKELCSRIRKIVAAFIKFERTPCCCRLIIPCLVDDDTESDIQVYIEETDYAIVQDDSHEETQRNNRSTVYCDVGIQSDEVGNDANIGTHLQDENITLRRQLAQATQLIQEQSGELTELRDKLEALHTKQLRHIDHEYSQETLNVETENEISDNFDVTETHLKSKEYELNSLKKDYDVLLLKSEEYKETLQNYDQVVEENSQLKIEKTDSGIQMSLLQKKIVDLEKELKIHIDQENSLRNELALIEASLLNAQNDKGLHDLARHLGQIASMSMTVKKVFGNYDPAHANILPQQDELYQKALSGKIGRIYPQIYYKTTKR